MHGVPTVKRENWKRVNAGVGTKMEMEHMIEAGEEKNEECSEMDVDEVQLAKKKKKKKD